MPILNPIQRALQGGRDYLQDQRSRFQQQQSSISGIPDRVDKNAALSGAYMTALTGAVPQALYKGAQQLSETKNPITRAIGSVAKVPLSFMAPSDEEVESTMRVFGGKPITKEQGQVLKRKGDMTVMGMASPLESTPVANKLPKVIQRVLQSKDEIISALESGKVGFRLSPNELDLDTVQKLPDLYKRVVGQAPPRGVSPQYLVQEIGNAYQSALEVAGQVSDEVIQKASRSGRYLKGEGGRFAGSSKSSTTPSQTVFHGTNADFKDIDISKSQRNMFGKGFYVTTDPKVAEMYGLTTKEFSLAPDTKIYKIEGVERKNADFNTARSLYREAMGKDLPMKKISSGYKKDTLPSHVFWSSENPEVLKAKELWGNYMKSKGFDAIQEADTIGVLNPNKLTSRPGGTITREDPTADIPF